MCLCFLYFSNNPQAKIKSIILFNREEFLRRSAKGLGFHPLDSVNQDILLYPLDIPTQGTFFCLNVKNGNFSFLLNNPFSNNNYNSNCKLKRGSLPLEFCGLSNEELAWKSFFEKLNYNKSEYNGFNLICGNFKTGIVKYFTNNIQDLKFNSENIIACKSEPNNILKINTIFKDEYEKFNYNEPYELHKSEIYVISNTFLFDGVERIKFGGNIFKDLLNKYNNYYKFYENNEEKLNCDEFEKSNEYDIFERFIREIFKMMENRIKLQINHEECINIIKTDPDYLNNKILDDYHCSSLFMDDKIDEFFIEYGTRNTIALLYDNESILKVIDYEDKVIVDNNYLTNEKRDFDKNVKFRQFLI